MKAKRTMFVRDDPNTRILFSGSSNQRTLKCWSYDPTNGRVEHPLFPEDDVNC